MMRWMALNCLVFFASVLAIAETPEEQLQAWFKERSELLPPGTLLEFKGEFKFFGKGPTGAFDKLGNAATFRAIHCVGRPELLYFESDNFLVPWGKKYSEYRAACVGNGHCWVTYKEARRGAMLEDLPKEKWRWIKEIWIEAQDPEHLHIGRPWYAMDGIYDASCVLVENMNFYRESGFLKPLLGGARLTLRDGLTCSQSGEEFAVEYAKSSMVPTLTFSLPDWSLTEYVMMDHLTGHPICMVEYFDSRPVVGLPELKLPHQFVRTYFSSGVKQGEIVMKLDSITLLEDASPTEVFATPLRDGWTAHDDRTDENFLIHYPSRKADKLAESLTE